MLPNIRQSDGPRFIIAKSDGWMLNNIYNPIYRYKSDSTIAYALSHPMH